MQSPDVATEEGYCVDNNESPLVLRSVKGILTATIVARATTNPAAKRISSLSEAECCTMSEPEVLANSGLSLLPMTIDNNLRPRGKVAYLRRGRRDERCRALHAISCREGLPKIRIVHFDQAPKCLVT